MAHGMWALRQRRCLNHGHGRGGLAWHLAEVAGCAFPVPPPPPAPRARLTWSRAALHAGARPGVLRVQLQLVQIQVI